MKKVEALRPKSAKGTSKNPPKPAEQPSVWTRRDPSLEERETGRRITQLRKTHNWTQRELAASAGVTQQNVSDAENGRIPHVKRLSAIAAALNVTVDYLYTGKALIDSARPAAETRAELVPLLGPAGAGRLIDVSQLETPALVPRFETEHFARLSQYALRVEGRSMEKRIPDGSIAFCVKYSEARQGLISGDYVHAIVKRTEHIQEWTIKRLNLRFDGVLELWPESYDPRYQEPLIYDPRSETGEASVIIEGFVIGQRMSFD